jgi:hypothetical protein
MNALRAAMCSAASRRTHERGHQEDHRQFRGPRDAGPTCGAEPRNAHTGTPRSRNRHPSQAAAASRRVGLRRLRRCWLAIVLYERLQRTLHSAGAYAATIARPITDRLQGEGWRGNRALWGLVPTTANHWVQINEATSDQAAAGLDYLRSVLATWNARRAEAEQVSDRMLNATDMPTAAEYAVALHTADMLAFTGAKLDMLYAGIMHSMPVYRLYPATPEREAIALWWPWGRPPPLVDGGPAKPPKPRKKILDPSIITAARPQDVVREVMQRTGINRTTAQHLTAPMRIGMRMARRRKAEALLRQGVTKAEVARSVGLSPSRLSAMFKGQTFRTKNALLNRDLTDDEDEDEDYK